MWYAARLLFESIKTGGPNPPLEEPNEQLFEEDIFLIQAQNEEAALTAACDIGYKQEHAYLNIYGQTVTWQFTAVVDIQDLTTDEVGHGTEVYYRLIGPDQVDGTPRWKRSDR